MSCIVLGGCKSSLSSAEIAQISGKWYAKPANNSYNPGSSGFEALFGGGNSSVALDISQDGKFHMDLFGTPVEGKYETTKERIYLNVEKVGGFGGLNPFESKTQFKGKFLFDKKVIFFAGRSGWKGYCDLRFTREAPADQKVGPRTVNAAEAGLVGDYDFDPSVKPTPGMSVGIDNDYFLTAMYSSNSLSLREDNTCMMNFLFGSKGTWRFNGDVVAMSSSGGLMAGHPTYARVAKFGQQLLVLSDSGGTEFALKKRK